MKKMIEAIQDGQKDVVTIWNRAASKTTELTTPTCVELMRALRMLRDADRQYLAAITTVLI